MSSKKKINQNPTDTEREIRKHRKFDLSEAVGREAAGALKGASPVTRARQLRLQVQDLLERHLYDVEGSLLRTILTDLEGNPTLLARHFEDPHGLLKDYLGSLLQSETGLAGLVRRADALWGREYQERPHFNVEGQEPHPDDPYTPDQVANQLRDFLEKLD
jgi:hypothetical protein